MFRIVREQNLLWEGEFLVASKLLGMTLFLALPALFWGCSAIVPERKAPADRPKIIEEDVTDDRATRPNIADEAPQSAEEAPPAVQPEHRSPRRFMWRDRKGSVKGWESPTEGSGGREP